MRVLRNGPLFFFLFLPAAASAVDMDEMLGHSHLEEETAGLEASADVVESARRKIHKKEKSHGFHFGAGYTMSVLGNPVGGVSQGMAFAGLYGMGVDVDLEHWFGWKDAVFRVSGSWATGSSLSEDYIGNQIDVSNVFSGRGVRLYEVSLRDSFFDERLEIRLGRLSVGARFALSPHADAFVNLSFNENLAAVLYNNPAFVADPVSVWALLLSWSRPELNWRIRAGAYDASSPDQWRDSISGTDFSFDPGAGLLTVMQIDTWTQQGLPFLPREAALSAGFFVDTGKRPVLDDETKERSGNVNFWLTLEQSLASFREEVDDLSAFLTLTGAPQAELNTFVFAASGGLVWRSW
ncbi:MAG: carbohydrate porin, partial [bacterium]